MSLSGMRRVVVDDLRQDIVKFLQIETYLLSKQVGMPSIFVHILFHVSPTLISLLASHSLLL